MNLAPMLGKKVEKLFLLTNSQSSQVLAPEPPSLFVEPQEKNPSMCHLLHSQIQSLSNAILLLLMDILIYSIFPMSWSFMSLPFFITQLGVMTSF